MRALVFNKELIYRDNYPSPEPGEGEALIRVTHAGICNTDLEIIKGYMNFTGVPGHEFVGVVESPLSEELCGRRVTGEINLSCGDCHYCRNNMRNHCAERSVLGIHNKDGVFAEYITLPVRNLHLIPDSVSDEEAVFTEPLAAAYEILEQVNITSDDSVCILGDGKLGLLVGQVLSFTGCRLILLGKHEKKLTVFEKKGIRTGYADNMKEREFDIVVDCSGSQAGTDTALSIVRPGGRVILKTTLADRRSVDLNSVVIHELTLTGSRCGPFPPAIKAIEDGKVDVTCLVSGLFCLEDGVKAFDYASRKDVLKVIIKVDRR